MLTKNLLLPVENMADAEAVWQLTAELAREKAAIRSGASPKYPFDGRWREVERWLRYDGWIIENNDLVRVTPASEDGYRSSGCSHQRHRGKQFGSR
jgi:hypothetical protein